MNEHTTHHGEDHTGHAPATQGQAEHADHHEHAPDAEHQHRGHHTGHDDHAGHRGAAGAPHGHDHHGGHGGHAGHGDHVGQFRRLFWIMLALAVPVVGFNEMFAHLLGYHLPDAEWVWWVSPVLGTVIYAWGGWPFLTGALSEVRSRKPGMMLLIGLAITVAFVASWGATLHLIDHELNFWWELALLDAMSG